MKITEILKEKSPTVSFEFFPPRSEKAATELYETIVTLEKYQPDFVSVTYGAGGTTRELTQDLVLKIITETNIPVVPHLTCVCHKEDEIREIIEQYSTFGVDNILALRGDLPKGKEDYDRNQDDFYYAEDLVKFVNQFNGSGSHKSAGFDIGVAGFPEGHPETPNRVKEMDYFKAKVDAGADYICTQLFFNNDDLYDFRDRCDLAGINLPIIAGIMPLNSKKGMNRMAELAAGARYPARLLRKLQAVEGDDISEVGKEYAVEQCQDLIVNGIDGLHLYTLNKSKQTIEVLEELDFTV